MRAKRFSGNEYFRNFCYAVLVILSLWIFSSQSLAVEKSSRFDQNWDSAYQKIRVARVLKADTIILENEQKFRIIGLKAPDAPRLKREVAEDRYSSMVVKDDDTKISPITSIEEQAFDFAKSLLEGKYVRLEFDVQTKSEDRVNLAYVFLIEGNTFVNAEIIRQGFANLQIRPPNTKYSDQLREAYREAREEKRGLQGDD